MENDIQSVAITTESIHLDQLLKWIGISETGGQARIIIDNGDVLINGAVVRERRKQVKPGDILTVERIKYLVILEDQS